MLFTINILYLILAFIFLYINMSMINNDGKYAALCCAVRCFPTKKDAYKAFEKGRCVFLKDCENANGKELTKSFARCSRKHQDSNLCWKHKETSMKKSGVILINEITEENGYSIANGDEEYFMKRGKSIKDSMIKNNFISKETMNKIEKISKSAIRDEYLQKLSELNSLYLNKLEEKNSHYLVIDSSDDESSNTESNVSSKKDKSNKKSNNKQNKQNIPKEQEIVPDSDSDSNDEETLKTNIQSIISNLNNIDEPESDIDDCEKANIEDFAKENSDDCAKANIEDCAKANIDDCAKANIDSELIMNPLNDSDLEGIIKDDEEDVNIDDIDNDEPESDDEENVRFTSEEDDESNFEKIEINSKFGKSKETEYQKLRGNEYYLNNDNNKVFSIDKKYSW